MARLSPDQLFRPCDPDQFDFATTSDLDDLGDMVGQSRAVEAVRFAVDMDVPGYNLFVLGPPGTGKHSFVRRFLAQRSRERERAPDWCYVNNFSEPRKPHALALPPGWGYDFVLDLQRVVDEARATISAQFESDDYRQRRQRIEEEFAQEQSRRLEEIQESARRKGIALGRTPQGLTFTPLKDGRPMDNEEIQHLSPEEQQRLQGLTEEIGRELQQAMQDMPRVVRRSRQRIEELDRETADLAVGSLIDDIAEKYRGHQQVAAHLERMRADIVENISLFTGDAEQPAGDARQSWPDAAVRSFGAQQPGHSPARQRYAVNLMVDNRDADGAPLVFEEHPTYQNLIGEAEYLAQMGALVTDFTLIQCGALHRANGGYLVIDARKLLMQPFAWEALKQALKSGEIRIEPMGQAYQSVRTATLEPEPIPLDAKVVLIGDRWLYYRLQALDPEFDELFRVAADFDDRMPRDPEANRLMAELLGTIARQESLKPLAPGGIARLVEESSRIAGHRERLSAEIRRTADLMREANLCARDAGHELIDGADVQCAIDARERRSSRLRERLRDEMLEETLVVETAGERVGQVNGLSVIALGDYAFGRPSRISARVAVGTGRVLDIERETELGGPLHSKGVLILSGFIVGRYAREQPLSLAASLVFEQSYGGVDGDSAAAGELVALLSAIADVPVRQNLAITGSVDQHGRLQAIGGANEKIEGFFELCRERGLDGTQGVLIPEANVKHLMLRQEVVDAVAAERFAVHAVADVDEALALLTGRPAGAADDAGRFPADTVNGAVQSRLEALAEARRGFAGGGAR
ncbi:MAG: AAA family ATPase [Pseudomonadota bacterium]